MQCKIGNRLRGGSGPVVWEGWHREASPIPIFDPSRPLAAQGDAFWWGRDDILELSESFEGFRRVVRGIDREQRSFIERNFAVSLNGGTGPFGRLTAACFGARGEVLELIEA